MEAKIPATYLGLIVRAWIYNTNLICDISSMSISSLSEKKKGKEEEERREREIEKEKEEERRAKENRQ